MGSDPESADSAETAEEAQWHALSPDEALKRLESSKQRGLDEDDVERRRQEYGPNRLPEQQRETLLRTFLRQFGDPLIYILLAAGAVSVAIGNVNDAVFIFAVLLLNAGLGTYQEYKAESAAEALKKVMKITARTLRSGKRREVDGEDLVPGDIVMLESGWAVPADIRLVESRDLQVDESLLTGESVPVEKAAEADIEKDTPLAERMNLAHAGSTVTSGRASGIVTRTGERTEIGRIAESVAEESHVPPLVVRMRRFTRIIALGVLLIIIALGTAQWLQGGDLTEVFLLSVALAVSAIPAGLPVAITVALSIGASRMTKQNVIVRKLAAVEGLGACTLILSDKTGTLTENELTLSRIRPAEGEDVEVTGTSLETEGEVRRESGAIDLDKENWLRRLAISGALCNEAEISIDGEGMRTSGDTVDVGFLVFAGKLGLGREKLLEEHPEIGSIPFESERKFAASFNRDGDRIIAHVKGAAEEVVRMCPDADTKGINAAEEKLARSGYRVLAVASGDIDEETASDGSPERLQGLEFLGLVGFIDPVREEVPEAVESCHRAGIDVRMITGDHPTTAMAIARQLHIASHDEDVASGKVFAENGGEDGEKGASAHAFARVEPRQKTAILETLQRDGHFVTVTGDGVNDAPALRAAHIGVAMGKGGTDVARSAADLILTDDNFASILKGVEQGRIAYDNVRKVIWLLISTGVAELVLFTLSVAFGTALPLTPVQLLWLNLVTNGVQDVALAFEKGDPDVLDRQPRPPKEGIFNRLMVEEVVTSGVYMGLVAFAVFYVLVELWGNDTAQARNLLLLLLVLFENVHIFNVRSETRSAFRIPLSNNWLVVGAVIISQGIHIGSMYVPGWRDLLGIEPVTFVTWATLLAITLSKFLVVEAYKHLRGRKLAERVYHRELPGGQPGASTA